MKKYFIILAVLIVSLGATGVVKAGTANTLSGWGWSSTIGWLSFNSSDPNTGDGGSGRSGVSYGVTMSTTTATAGTFDGYAWSSNIGWVSFKAADTAACGSPASVNLSTGKVTGWAVALAGVGRTDGWDGCIELSDNTFHVSPGSATTGGVTLSTTTGAFRGLSWGDTNVGWLSFVGVICPGCVGTTTPPTGGNLAISCSANPTSLATPGPITFTATTNGGTVPYYWNGSLSSGSNSTTTYIASYSGVSVPFTVRDSASPANTGSQSCSAIVTSCPGGNCGGGTTCTIDNPSASIPFGSTYVTITRTISNAVSGQTYTPASWNLGAVSNQTLSVTENPSGNVISCTPPVSVTGGATQTDLGPITLRAYKSLSSTGTTTLRIGVNRDAFMGWHKQTGLNLTGYSCRGVTVTKPLGSSWNDTFNTSVLSINEGADTLTNYSTSVNRMRLGRYNFYISCTKTGNDPILSNPVDIIVTTSGIQEI